MEQLACHWSEIREILHLIIFRKSVEKIQVLLKSDKNTKYCACRPMGIYDNVPNMMIRSMQYDGINPTIVSCFFRLIQVMLNICSRNLLLNDQKL